MRGRRHGRFVLPLRVCAHVFAECVHDSVCLHVVAWVFTWLGYYMARLYTQVRLYAHACEVETLTAAIETALTRIGELGPSLD